MTFLPLLPLISAAALSVSALAPEARAGWVEEITFGDSGEPAPAAEASAPATPLDMLNGLMPGPKPPLAPVLSPQADPQAPVDNPFVATSALKRNVDFWIQIYSVYDTTQAVFHDSKYVDKIYEVVTLPEGGRERRKLIRDTKRKWREVLQGLHRRRRELAAGPPPDLVGDARKVFDLYADLPDPNRFIDAAHRKRFRYQLGQKDRFAEGLRWSGRYLPTMEAIFKREGLPLELTRLPFVESSFNIRARSKVGASGIWQFMRSTGRLFLKINAAVDERNDPILSTEAAAKLLRQNYESLGNWPLAVTAYNHGRMGMMRAVRRVGSSRIEDVVAGYRSRSFGFASSNFFAELLAAVAVEREAEKHFGKIVPDSPHAFFEFELPDSVQLPLLARLQKIDMDAIRELNPAILTPALKGWAWLPAGYRLRVPTTAGASLAPEAEARIFEAGYDRIPASYKKPGRKRRKQPELDYGKRAAN